MRVCSGERGSGGGSGSCGSYATSSGYHSRDAERRRRRGGLAAPTGTGRRPACFTTRPGDAAAFSAFPDPQVCHPRCLRAMARCRRDRAFPPRIRRRHTRLLLLLLLLLLLKLLLEPDRCDLHERDCGLVNRVRDRGRTPSRFHQGIANPGRRPRLPACHSAGTCLGDTRCETAGEEAPRGACASRLQHTRGGWQGRRGLRKRRRRRRRVLAAAAIAPAECGREGS